MKPINVCISKKKRKREIKAVPVRNFTCRYGTTPEEALDIEVNDIGKHIASAEEQNLESFYLEILAKPGYKPKSKK